MNSTIYNKKMNRLLTTRMAPEKHYWAKKQNRKENISFALKYSSKMAECYLEGSYGL